MAKQIMKTMTVVVLAMVACTAVLANGMVRERIDCYMSSHTSYNLPFDFRFRSDTFPFSMRMSFASPNLYF